MNQRALTDTWKTAGYDLYDLILGYSVVNLELNAGNEMVFMCSHKNYDNQTFHFEHTLNIL